MMIRLADADLLPFEFTNLADTVQTYVKELETLLKTQQDDARERNKQIERGSSPRSTIRSGRCRRRRWKTVPPALNFAPLENAAEALTQAAARYHSGSGHGAAEAALNTTPLVG